MSRRNARSAVWWRAPSTGFILPDDTGPFAVKRSCAMLTEPDVGCPLRFEIQGVDPAAEFSDPGIGKRYTDPRPAYSGVGCVRSMNGLPDPCDRGGVKSPGVLPDCELVLVPSLLRLEGLDAHTVQIRGQRHPMAVEFEGQTDRPADFAVELQIQFYVVQDHPG